MLVRLEGRLALFAEKADAAYWESGYEQVSESNLVRALRPTSHLGVHQRFFRKWLTKPGAILEAGCGNGMWVSRLRANGYDCFGMDYAVGTLARSHAIRNDLPLAGGDLEGLPLADDALGGYLSFGVIEHSRTGPQTLLREAHRVLRPNGILCVSVPYDNFFRRRTETVTEAEAHARGFEFYQFFFTPQDLANELQKAGLEPQASFHGYYSNLGLKQALGKKAPWSASFWGSRAGLMLDFVPGLPRVAGHMMFMAAIRR